MLVFKSYRKTARNDTHFRSFEYSGWFLFGIIPLYIRRRGVM
jgi:hypothetical protein